MTEAKVRGLLSKGILLINIVTSTNYPDNVRDAAMKLMRKNVVGLIRIKKEDD